MPFCRIGSLKFHFHAEQVKKRLKNAENAGF